MLEPSFQDSKLQTCMFGQNLFTRINGLAYLSKDSATKKNGLKVRQSLLERSFHDSKLIHV
jgi:hypothetical protein